jgi:hypothetical protein
VGFCLPVMLDLPSIRLVYGNNRSINCSPPASSLACAAGSASHAFVGAYTAAATEHPGSLAGDMHHLPPAATSLLSGTST